MGRLALALFLALAAALAGAARAQQPRTVERIEVGPLSRIFVLERFHAEQAQGRLPVVIYLHPINTLVSAGVLPRFDIPFDAQPAMEPALILRPQGANRRWDSVPPGVPTPRRLAGTDGEQVDDIAFLRLLIKRMVETENGDPDRVYIAGVSSGGYLAARVACEMTDVVAAAADVIATATRSLFRLCSDRPMPFALIAATTDDQNPYDGEPGNDVDALATAPETAFFFARRNRCSTVSQAPLPHDMRDNDSTISLTRFSGCADDAEVLFWRIDGGWHSVPSRAPIGPEGWDASGRRNRDMETAEALWEFFRARRLAGAR